MKYVAPRRDLAAFSCPHCGAYAQQHHWSYFSGSKWVAGGRKDTMAGACQCSHCYEWSFWRGEQMIYPSRGTAPPPHDDTPEDVKRLYEEAASISGLSPRGAGALLRLAIQQLCDEIEPGARSINEAIGRLVKRGAVSEVVRKALDVVRVTGNEAVHPGTIDTDDIEVVDKLFPLINLIVESAVSMPARVEALYDSLPDSAREQIEKRDGLQLTQSATSPEASESS